MKVDLGFNLPFPTHASDWDRLRWSDPAMIERREKVPTLSCKCGKNHTDTEVLVLNNGIAHNLCPDEGLFHRLRDRSAAKSIGCSWYDESTGTWMVQV